MKDMKKYPVFILLILFQFSVVCGQDYPRERVYLQTDKETYLAGELMWVKMYSSDVHGVPFSLSTVGYIELLNAEGPVAQMKIELKDGTGSGCIQVPASSPTGNYRLAGYTRYMLNEGEEVFFTKIISLINTFTPESGKYAVEESDPEHFTEDIATRRPGNVTVIPDTDVYGFRSDGYFQIEGLPSDVHSLAVSIAGKDLFGNKTDILGWYNSDKKTSVVFSGDYLPEYEGMVVNVRFTGRPGEPLPGDGALPFLSVVGEQVMVYSGVFESDKAVFTLPRIKGKREMATSLFGAGGRIYSSQLYPAFMSPSPVRMPELVLTPGMEMQLVERSVALQALNLYGADQLYRWREESMVSGIKPDKSYKLDEYTRFPSMRESVVEFIPELRFRSEGNNMKMVVLNRDVIDLRTNNSLVLLDGIPVEDQRLIYDYDPGNLKQIDIYRDKYVIGGNYFDGIVNLISYENNYPGLGSGNNIQVFDYEGVQAPRLFHAPVYSSGESISSPLPDMRHTLLWTPDIRPQGMSTLMVPFSTSDLAGEYTINVEGVTKEGKPVFGYASFVVR